MKRFWKIYGACLMLEGLFLVLCMGWPAGGMLLLCLFQGNPFLSWMLSALAPAILLWAWTAWKERSRALGTRSGNLEDQLKSDNTFYKRNER